MITERLGAVKELSESMDSGDNLLYSGCVQRMLDVVPEPANVERVRCASSNVDLLALHNQFSIISSYLT